MQVLNVACIAPLSSSHTKTLRQQNCQSKPKSCQLLDFKQTHTRLTALVSSVFLANSDLAKALTYEEALGQSRAAGASSFDANGLVDGIVSFATENALVVGGVSIALSIPIILFQVLGGKSRNFGVDSSKQSYVRLSEDAAAQLLDIREAKELKESGTPDLRSLKKKVVCVEYRRDNKSVFLKKLASKFKNPENTTLFILDKFTGNSELVAELAAINGFKAAFAIRDGAEGNRGWKNNGLPWSLPKKSFTVDFGNLNEAISGALEDGNKGLPALGLAAATGLAGVVAFSEIETVLQLLGSAAIIQFATKKLLFAQDRKRTLGQIEEFIDTKIASNELVDRIKAIGKSIPLDSTNMNVTSAPPALVTVVEPSIEPSEEINPVPNAELKQPKSSRSLSPFPYYPDMKPPSSPAPTKA